MTKQLDASNARALGEKQRGFYREMIGNSHKRILEEAEQKFQRAIDLDILKAFDVNALFFDNEDGTESWSLEFPKDRGWDENSMSTFVALWLGWCIYDTNGGPGRYFRQVSYGIDKNGVPYMSARCGLDI